jgi:GNAT superfamily N-acetyltransferase
MPVRVAQPADVAEITVMMLEHAAHEGALDQCRFNDADATAALFGPDAMLHALIASPPNQPSTIAGCALWYPTFSSWAATTGIWLEDLFIRPAFRGHGLGREILDDLRARTTGRIEWDVVDDNIDAQAFYRRLGAAAVPGFSRFRWLPRPSGSVD